MVAAKEKTLSLKVDPIVNRMDNKSALPTATKEPSTVVNRISSYDFRTRKFSKLPIGTSEKIHLIVAVENQHWPREYIGENVVRLRRLHRAPGMSLYRAYFVPSGVDPSGLDVWVENGTQVGGWHQRICVDTYDASCKKTGKFCISFGVDGTGEGGSCADGGVSDDDGLGNPGLGNAGTCTDAYEEDHQVRPPGAPTRFPMGNECPTGNGVVYVDGEAGQTYEWGRITSCCDQDIEIKKFLESYKGLRGNYAALWGQSCRTFSKSMYYKIEGMLKRGKFGECPPPPCEPENNSTSGNGLGYDPRHQPWGFGPKY